MGSDDSADADELETGLTSGQREFLEKVDDEVFPVTPPPNPPSLLFHYTNAESFRSIVRSRELWATHFRFANDTGEITYGEELIIKQVQGALDAASGSPERALFDRVVRLLKMAPASAIFDLYVASLSEERDQLSQWRAYGQDGAGLAIGFRSFPQPTGTPDNATGGLSLLQCSYDERAFAAEAAEILLRAGRIYRARRGEVQGDRRMLAAVLRRATFATGRKLVAEALRLKHPAFKEEREWRLVFIMLKNVKNDEVKFRPTPLGPAPYVGISLVSTPEARCDIGQVVVGPAPNSVEAQISARIFLAQAGYPGDDLVVRSTIPYRGAGR